MTHGFRSSGVYAVAASAGPSRGTCVVTVISMGHPPVLAGCSASPADARVGEAVEVSADLRGTPLDNLLVLWGDGSETVGLPAVYRYREPGRYSATVTATNEYGFDTCLVTVSVSPRD